MLFKYAFKILADFFKTEAYVALCSFELRSETDSGAYMKYRGAQVESARAGNSL